MAEGNLEIRKVEKEIEKLDAETRALDYQLSPPARRIEHIKALAGLGGVVTAIVAIVGLWFSVSRWQDDLQQSREVRVEERLNRAFESVAASDTAKQLSGLASLRSFLTEDEPKRHKQVLSILVSILAIEKEPIVRNSIVATFEELNASFVDGSVLDHTLGSLITVSRGLVLEDDLQNTRFTHPKRPPRASTTEARAQSVGYAITTFFRLGGVQKDASGIYCTKCDFSGLDLSDVNFDNSILYLSDFSKGLLLRTSFDGADLEHTRFVEADLKQASLTLMEDPRPGGHRKSYVGRLLDRKTPRSQIAIYGPNFNCADLRDADFSGHPVFGFESENAKLSSEAPPLLVFAASFVGANLKGADFSKATMYGSRAQKDGLPFPISDGQESVGQYRLFQYSFLDFEHGTIDKNPYKTALYWMRSGFSGTNWQEADFPAKVVEWLIDHPPSGDMDFGIRDSCKPRSPP